MFIVVSYDLLLFELMDEIVELYGCMLSVFGGFYFEWCVWLDVE